MQFINEKIFKSNNFSCQDLQISKSYFLKLPKQPNDKLINDLSECLGDAGNLILDLSYINITHSQMDTLLYKGLKNNPTIYYLTLEGNNIERNIESLNEILPTTKLTCFNFSNTCLTTGNLMTGFLANIKKNVEILNLSNNDIREPALILIIDELFDAPNLEQIYLTGNPNLSPGAIKRLQNYLELKNEPYKEMYDYQNKVFEETFLKKDTLNNQGINYEIIDQKKYQEYSDLISKKLNNYLILKNALQNLNNIDNRDSSLCEDILEYDNVTTGQDYTFIYPSDSHIYNLTPDFNDIPIIDNSNSDPDQNLTVYNSISYPLLALACSGIAIIGIISCLLLDKTSEPYQHVPLMHA